MYGMTMKSTRIHPCTHTVRSISHLKRSRLDSETGFTMKVKHSSSKCLFFFGDSSSPAGITVELSGSEDKLLHSVFVITSLQLRIVCLDDFTAMQHSQRHDWLCLQGNSSNSSRTQPGMDRTLGVASVTQSHDLDSGDQAGRGPEAELLNCWSLRTHIIVLPKSQPTVSHSHSQ